MENREKKEISDHYQEIGKILGDSLSEGLSESSDGVREASDHVYDELLGSYQYFLKEKERLQRESSTISEEISQQSYQSQLSRAKTEEKANEIHQKELLRQQKKASQESLKEVKAYLKEIEKLKKEVISDFNDIASRAKAKLEEVSKSREKMMTKLQDYGGLFDERTVILRNVDPKRSKFTYNELIADLSDEREELQKYADLLGQVRGIDEIPKELLTAIQELSIHDGIRFQEELLAMSPEARAKYLGDYSEILKLSQEIADISYADETALALEEIERELAGWFGSIPEGFFAEGEFSAEAFGEGFIKKLGSLQEVLKEAVLSVVSIEERDTMSSTNETAGQTSVTYILNSAGETVAEQLRSAESHVAKIKLRGV